MPILVESYERVERLKCKLSKKPLIEATARELVVLTDNLLMYLSMNLRSQVIMPLLSGVSIYELSRYEEDISEALNSGLDLNVELSYLGIFLAIIDMTDHNISFDKRLVSNIRKLAGYRDGLSGLFDRNLIEEFDRNSASPLLESFIKSLKYKEIGGVKPRKYVMRSRSEFADPSKPATHEVNRTDTQFRARMSHEFNRAIENWIDDNGLSKKEAAEYAFRLAMSQPFDRSVLDGPKV